MAIRHVAPVVVAGLVLAGCGWAGIGEKTFTDEESIGQDVTKVRFDNDSGDVKITIGDEITVHRNVSHHEDDKPGKTHRVEGDTLVLEQCPAANCSVDYEVTVPEGTEVDGHVDSGVVELVGVAAVNVEAESGDITVRDVPGSVNASVQSGRITLSGIGGAVVATAESGDVEVGLTEPQDVTVTTSSGDIQATVPDGSYRVTTSVDSGTLENDLENDPSGEHTLTFGADSGNITVRKA